MFAEKTATLTETGIHYLDAHGPDGMRLYAIGDVHGRHDLLAAMHRRIESELEYEAPKSDWRIIHLGDYVDRGPDSKSVIEFLIDARKRDPRNIMLAGNHDIGMLDFLAKPDPDGLFMRYGGVQTALSYGVKLSAGSGWFGKADEALLAGHAALVAAVPQSHVAFLRSLEFSVAFGDFFFCHAGIRPGVPLESQSKDDLIWIRDAFHDHPGLFSKVIVHGHTPVPEAEVMANRVNVDTLAWQSGMLSALAVSGTDKRILTVEGKP